MLGLFLNPLVLCVLVWLVARGTADIDFGKMFFIALGVGIVGTLAAMFLGGGYVGLLALIPILGLLLFLLMKYCYLTLQQGLIVTGLYFLYQVGFAVAIHTMLSR
ncbi:MAG: hypothetical protein L0Y71_21465 [Gemmataceae bacterium]|nr:hypothetical protein [Gemmataceae bacterium]